MTRYINAIFDKKVLELPTDEALKFIEADYPNQSQLFYLSVLNRIRRNYGLNPITSLSRALASPTNGRKGGRPRKHYRVTLTSDQLNLLKIIVGERVEYALNPAPILTETLAALNAS